GEAASLDSPIADGDTITVVAGKNGEDAHVFVRELLDQLDTLDIVCNDRPLSLGPVIHVNGTPAQLDDSLADRAEVEIRLPRTISEVLEAAGLLAPDEQPAQSGLHFSVNGQSYTLPAHNPILLLNGKTATFNDAVRQGDELSYRLEEIAPPAIRDVIPLEE
ncbi:cell division protein FtsA, partial [Mesorhizobium sp. M00.F.Ca.ET.186.01.1.1]